MHAVREKRPTASRTCQISKTNGHLLLNLPSPYLPPSTHNKEGMLQNSSFLNADLEALAVPPSPPPSGDSPFRLLLQPSSSFFPRSYDDLKFRHKTASPVHPKQTPYFSCSSASLYFGHNELCSDRFLNKRGSTNHIHSSPPSVSSL